MFVKLQKYIDDFLSKKSGTKMVIMPGFRGVGKTTLMAQTCTEYQNKVGNILFLSVEDAKNLFDAGIAELMSAYEEILGNNLESVKEPILEIPAEPFHVLYYGIHVFLFLFGGIGVVETQIKFAFIAAGKPGIEADGLGVADMQIAVRLRREPGVHPAGVLAGG